MSDPIDDLNYCLRQRLLADTTVAAAGVYFLRTPSSDVSPAVVFAPNPETGNDSLAGVAWWEVDYNIYCIADEASDGTPGPATAYDLRSRCYAKLDGGTAATRKTNMDALNALLGSRGWTAMMPVASRGIAMQIDSVNEKERAVVGIAATLRIQPL